jgi:magnesium transporter
MICGPLQAVYPGDYGTLARITGPSASGGSLVAMSASTRAYRKGVLDARDFPPSELSERLADPDTLVWVDLCRPEPEALDELAPELGLHELAIEDALEAHQRSKLDLYDTHAFLAVHAVGRDGTGLELRTTEVDAFIGRGWLVTVRADDGFGLDPVLERLERSPELLRAGVGVIVHALLDVIVDGYFEAIERLDDYYDEIGDSIFSDTPLGPDQQREWFETRRTLTRFYRLVAPLREALSTLVHRDLDVVAPEVRPYFQDLYDHVLVVSESADTLRDVATSLVEANLSLRDYRQNQVMKKVSSWAAVIAVPTLVTGYYGMNVPFPGSGERTGVVVATGLIGLLSLSLYLLFRRRDWL